MNADLNVEVNTTAGLVLTQDQSGLSSSCLPCDLLAIYAQCLICVMHFIKNSLTC